MTKTSEQTTKLVRYIGIAASCGGIFACPPAIAVDGVSPRPLGRDLPTYEAPVDPVAPPIQSPMPTGELRLRDALAAALLGNPGLASLSWEVRSREALAIQANTRPNPELNIEVEDFAGTGQRSAFDANQTTISIAQLVELGGKRAKRTRVAELQTTLSSWDLESERVAVLSDTTKSFLRVLSLQAAVEMVKDLESLSADSLRSVESTVRAGAVSPIEEERARVTLERVQLEAARTAKDLQAARTLLSSTWGATAAQFSRAEGDISNAPQPPDLDALLSSTEESPELARWSTEISEREARIALERARAIPDVVVSLGPRYYTDSDDVGAVARLAIPLPIFDRNRGSILDASYRRSRADVDRRGAEVTVRSRLQAALAQLEAAFAEVVTLRDKIIPRATKVYEETRRGYAVGLFRYIEVLDAQRTLFEGRRELLAAFTNYHLIATDLERLIAMPLDHLQPTTRPQTP